VVVLAPPSDWCLAVMTAGAVPDVVVVDRTLSEKGTAMTAFLLIAFGVAWGWEATAHLVLHWSLVNPLVQVPVGFAPALAAYVVRRWITREGFADAGSRLRLRAARRYYLMAWLGPVGVAAAMIAAAAVTGHWHPSAGPFPGLAPFVLLLLAPLTMVAFWGEEFGWTGYLLVRIWPGRPRRAALAAGLIAAVWHYPLAFLGYAEFHPLLPGLAGWTAWILCQEVILAWLRERSGSVWPACVAHAGNNLVLIPLTTGVLGGPGGFSDNGLQWLTVAVLVAVAAAPFRTVGRGATPEQHAFPPKQHGIHPERHGAGSEPRRAPGD
jgi:membrane protease YdiL (CAAX protease family)